MKENKFCIVFLGFKIPKLAIIVSRKRAKFYKLKIKDFILKDFIKLIRAKSDEEILNLIKHIEISKFKDDINLKSDKTKDEYYNTIENKKELDGSEYKKDV